MRKKRLTVDEQIDFLSEHGITFSMDDDVNSAHRFLTENTYFFKLKSYAANYEQDKQGKYKNLDFTQLRELSVLDFNLSRVVVNLCANIEHAMKVQFNCLLMDSTDSELGRKCIDYYYSPCTSHRLKLNGNPYTKDLVKSCETHPYIWDLWELLTFNDQIGLYNAYFTITKKENKDKSLLFIARKIRNAVAHGNCLLANVGRPSESMRKNHRTDSAVTSAAMKMCNKHMRRQKNHAGLLQRELDTLIINNVAAVLICHMRFVKSKGVLQHTYTLLSQFQRRMCKRQKELFGCTAGSFAPQNKQIDNTLTALCQLCDGYKQQVRGKIHNSFETVEKDEMLQKLSDLPLPELQTLYLLSDECK